MRIASVLVIVTGLLCGLAACGSSSDSSTADTSVAAAKDDSTTAKEAPEQAADGGWATLKRFAGPYADKLIIPEGPSPEQVVIRDLKVGSGPPIAAGDTFVSDYISWNYENEKVVEPLPEEPGQPVTWIDSGSLNWGVGDRVPGWEPGLKGIRAGGFRELIVPSRLAYENGVRVYLIKVKEIEPR
ncbi:MAG TPA: FKBP-type peptidyl-prolyl cis-trans isomerase [Solirubrobacterales bacterium]|nr:FKBP-type peptidyl-prolyl cis-trans isomerase [Solirubrobacterales bacterium]